MFTVLFRCVAVHRGRRECSEATTDQRLHQEALPPRVSTFIFSISITENIVLIYITTFWGLTNCLMASKLLDMFSFAATKDMFCNTV